VLALHHTFTTVTTMTTIQNGSRSNPDNLPVQTRMTPFQIAALKAMAAMEHTNSATLLRNLVDERIERTLTQGSDETRGLLVGLLKHGGFTVDLERVIGSILERDHSGVGPNPKMDPKDAM
jgi:hypothetical protein